MQIGIGISLTGLLKPGTPPTAAAPVNTVAPAISGIQTQGQTLSVSTGSWTGYPSPTFTYQWKRAGSAIGGETASTYLLALADVGAAITCAVTATNSQGAATATSASVTPNATLTISGTPGTTANVGSSYSFTPTTAGGHTPKTFSIVNKPSWASFTSATGQLTGTPSGAETDTGIVISVTDTDGLTASLASFTITVSVAPASLISSINGPTGGPVGAVDYLEGWSGEWASGTPPTFTPDSSPSTFSVTRQGYDATGTAVSNIVDTYTYTSRVRQPYPNQATPSTSTVALSDYVYSTDSIASVTNNSTLVSPVPISAPVMMHRLIVGNSLYWEVCAFHRDARGGKQVPCVIATASDGSNPVVTQVCSTPTISPRSTDKCPVIVYSGTMDITGLTDVHLITWNYKVYPWIGAAASVADSSSGTDLRGCSPRYFLKHTSKLASPPVCYVNGTGATYTSGADTVSIGNDTTGSWSTNPVTAKGLAFATMAGALNAVNNASRGTPATGGVIDGCIIRFGPGTNVMGGPTLSRTQNVGMITLTRDPNVSRGGGNELTFGTGSTRMQFSTGITAPVTTGAMRVTDMAVRRTGTGAITGESAVNLDLFWDDVDFDNGSQTVTWQSTSNPTHNWVFGMTMTNVTTSVLAPQGTYTQRLIRGLTADFANSGTMDCCPTIGSIISGSPGFFRGTLSYSGYFVAFNKFKNCGGMGQIAFNADVTGYAVVQNLLEYTSNLGNTDLTVSADGASGNATHVVIFNNTITGWQGCGRSNLFYDEGATARTNKLHAAKGNIHPQLNTKGDQFTSNGARIMNWAYMYGVGCQGEWSMYIDAAGAGRGSAFAQAYPGLGSSIGTSATVTNDPLFIAYAGTSGSPTAGAGGGNYNLNGGSPCKSRMTTAVLIADLAGAARPTTGDTTGAYA